MTRECIYCKKPIRNLRSTSTKRYHAPCAAIDRAAVSHTSPFYGSEIARTQALTGRASAAQSPRADIAREAAAPFFPISSLDADLPIEAEGGTMKRTAKKVIELQPRASAGLPTFDQVVAEGEAYEALKAEAERIAGELAKKADFLKGALANFPDGRVRIGERDLGLVPVASESFDLEAAKKKKALVKLLTPYIETIEKFDLKAARKHIDDATLAPFVKVKESVQLRFLKPGSGSGEAAGNE